MSRVLASRTGIVYALRDPRTNAIRYIGASSFSAEERLKGHLDLATRRAAMPNGMTDLLEWILSLKRDGLSPIAEALAGPMPIDEVRAAEYSIMLEHIASGADLLNVITSRPSYSCGSGRRAVDATPEIVRGERPAGPIGIALHGDARDSRDCLECRSEMVGRRETYRMPLAGGWSAIVENVMVYRCRACGDYEVEFEKLSGLMRALVVAVLRKPARLAGVEVTFLRNHLGLTGRELARTLGVSPAALSRWEQDKDPIGGISDRALRMLVALEKGIWGEGDEDFKRLDVAAIEGGDGRPVKQLMAKIGPGGEWQAVTSRGMTVTGHAA